MKNQCIGGLAECCFILQEQETKECGIFPNYINVLLMVDNWLPGFDMDEQRLIDKKIDKCLKTACLACVHHCPYGAMRLNEPEKNPNVTQVNTKMPKIALGAWAWGNDGTFGGTSLMFRVWC